MKYFFPAGGSETFPDTSGKVNGEMYDHQEAAVAPIHKLTFFLGSQHLNDFFCLDLIKRIEILLCRTKQNGTRACVEINLKKS